MSEENTPITVLFVDDDPDFLELASRLLELESEQIELLTESAPSTVIQRLNEAAGEIDCVVSDYQMTPMDGIELLESIREEYPTLPFILFTAHGDEEIASETIGAGGTDYVINTGSPDRYTVLANRIETIVGRQRSERLATQYRRIDSIYRTISQKLLTKPSKAQIEQTVCDSLAEFDAYRCVWIGDTTSQDEIDLRAVSDNTGDTGKSRIEETTQMSHSPEIDALTTETVTVINDAEAEFDTPHPLTEEIQLQSLITVPITSRGISYGGLTIYSDVPDAFTQAEVEMFTDLGDLIGFALTAAEQRQGVFAYTTTEIELTISDPSAPLIAVAQTLDTTVRLEGTIPRPDGTFVLFLEFGSGVDDTDTVREALEAHFETIESDQIDTNGRQRWTVSSSSWFGEEFTHHGVQIMEVVADPQTAHILLECPLSVDTRDIIELAEYQFADVELTAQRQRTQQTVPAPGSGSALADLTPRQKEVLEAAYRGGFFAWPRTATAEEIAETLNISQPAFSRHIRRSEQKVFKNLFDVDSDDSTT